MAQLQAAPAQPQQITEQGLSYDKAEQYAEAIAAFDRLIQLTSDYAGAYFNKGNALVGMGDTKRRSPRMIRQSGWLPTSC